jgi:nucleoside-diphosphate-sugar epimerase
MINNIFIIGGTGFVDSFLFLKFVSKDYSVRTSDNLSLFPPVIVNLYQNDV